MQGKQYWSTGTNIQFKGTKYYLVPVLPLAVTAATKKTPMTTVMNKFKLKKNVSIQGITRYFVIDLSVK